MQKEKIILSIRLRHPTMSSELIVNEFNIIPVINQSVGEKKILRNGKILDKNNEFTYIVFGFMNNSFTDLSDTIEYANTFMNWKDNFKTLFFQSGGTGEYYISISAKEKFAFEFLQETLKKCSENNVKKRVLTYTCSRRNRQIKRGYE
ncbi:hypothetical protein [Treponema brennaborense]|uniref:Uncharacterized protein n=1 Tax=Treponema brennaborense (strain DSM 12168 / CIP 105900 / DD5/3) TaxID=906968 RepID=F4LML4_TREBD|nr:hypothetical protein [Treponema brennaborense]AEE16761.1 hypothetical protein Trebr_1337 [Treponema brennaborense DSM 12168]